MPNSTQRYKKLLAFFTKTGWMQGYKIKWLIFIIDIRTKGINRWVLRELLPLRKYTSSASFAQWMYWLGFFLSILLLIELLLGVILHSNPSTVVSVLSILMYGALGCFAIGFTSEIAYLLITYWDNSIFKIFVSFVGLISATLSLVASRLLVNSLTRVDPSHFSIAVSIFTSLFTPIVWWGLASLALSLTYVALFMFVSLSYVAASFIDLFLAVRNSYIYRLFIHKRKVRYSGWLFWKSMGKSINWLSGAAGIITMTILIILSLSDHVFSQYPERIAQVVTNILVYSNYQPISDECKNYNPGEWIASIGTIGNRKISVAIPDGSGGYTFQVRSCN